MPSQCYVLQAFVILLVVWQFLRHILVQDA